MLIPKCFRYLAQYSIHSIREGVPCLRMHGAVRGGRLRSATGLCRSRSLAHFDVVYLQVSMSSTISIMLCFKIELYVCWYQSVFDIWCNTQYIELPGVPTLVGTYAMCLPQLARSNNIWHHANIWCHVPSSVDDIWCNTQYIELPGAPTLVGTYAMCLP